MAIAPDGRIFICQQGGQLRVVKNGALLSTPFLTVSVDSGGERGLLGVAMDPNFAANQYVYIYYTVPSSPRHNRVSRFTANGDVAVPGSETIILELNNLSASNHNGGALHFGLDGKLYIATGDNAVSSNAQTLNNLLGKILRINADGTIPTDNPFYNQATGNNRAIWALGLRNPFTFTFQPGTGRMFINDVGQSSREEINDGIAGSNYGWPNCEGSCSPSNNNYRDPLYFYTHADGCAITGGAFYNPSSVQFPSQYVGTYFFADFCSGWIRRFNPSNGSVTGFATNINAPVDLLVSPDGSLYYLAYNSGQLFRVQYTANQPPQIVTHPGSQTIAAGQPVTFTVSASGSAPLSYQWQRNGANISGATSTSYTISSVATSDNGAQFRCVVSNAFGSATSNAATLTVTSNTAPAANITSPVAGTLYNAGSAINYAGTGTDPQDGTLPPGAFTWKVDFHHDTHIHPFIPPTSGSTSGSFVIPNTGETSASVWYRINLTVTDSSGLTNSVFRDIFPRKSTITLQTSPAGLQVTLDGQPRAAPYSEESVVGMMRTLGVVSPQTVGGVTYEFVSWSDGGAASHTISTPVSYTTYTATYRVVSGGSGGDGLSATYYNNPDFTGSTTTRIDPVINFTWDDASPAPGISGGTFSARWTGKVQAQFSETYTFYTQTNDGIRLWVNNQLIIRNWTNHSLTEDSGTITLVAGQKYDIKIEFFYNYGGAAMRLLWSSASTPKTVVPQSQLFSTP
jgi:glucose/arabinose dehydrogenase